MNKIEMQRQVKLRLKIINHAQNTTGNVAKTCRYFGISRKTFYKWISRYTEYGTAALCDRSCGPKSSPNKTSKETAEKVLYLRKNYHFGACRIASYLKRYHEISLSPATVHNLLKEHGINRLPAYQKKYERSKNKWKRYEKQKPGHAVQIDVKFLQRIPGTRKRFYQFTAIDDCTRMRILKIYDSCNQKTAIEFVKEVVGRLPFRILAIQTDNGPEFQSNFHWYLEDNDIKHIYIKPRTPRLNGKVERSHRTDDREFYQLLDKGGIGNDIHLYNKKLKEWEDYYNLHRPHGGLHGQTPYERLRQKQG